MTDGILNSFPNDACSVSFEHAGKKYAGLNSEISKLIAE